MAFNGTQALPKHELVDYLQSIGMRFGADLNAYTNFDETVYMLKVPTDDPALLEKGLFVLQEWAHAMALEGDEIEKERGVVVEEWRLGRGAGGRLIDRLFPILFRGSRYAERLTRRMPEPLRVCYLLNSASEANELALRLARTHTGRRDVIVLDHAYHGNTGGLIEISPYKLNGPGGSPPPPWVQVAAIPDDYRGPYKRSDPEAGVNYARHVAGCIEAIGRRGPGAGVAAFIAETLPSVGGQIVLPPGYLAAVYSHVRSAGGLCIADEVQVGFGRLGADFWGFGTQGVVPDIVVLGKPIGNGFPLAAVVTTPEVAASFDNGMEFFSTFGGNPVACAAGLAVLDVVEEEGLQEHARHLGDHLLEGLHELAGRHALVGDVRGLGLFLGAELVRDRETLEPAGEEAGHVASRLRERGILAGTDGPHHNVLKIRPPLILGEADADFFLEVLDEVLGEDAVRVG